MGCHSAEKYKEKNAPKLGDSHMTMIDVPGGGMKKVMNIEPLAVQHLPRGAGRCAKPLVENAFKGNITAKP